jgi:hypothetical protein
MAHAAVDGCEIGANWCGGSVPRCCGGLEMLFDAGHQIQNHAVDVEHDQRQRMTEAQHEVHPPKRSSAVVGYNLETSR